jgi:hypothetical protein
VAQARRLLRQDGLLVESAPEKAPVIESGAQRNWQAEIARLERRIMQLESRLEARS